ncbi:MAG TPA: aspartate carbamoyltransferase catalytic subunit [Myxococcaceae bacterium]|nr:aspartate carbamoyltransferase catalytic subunit [Myxococcaceae bacterium]
MRVPRTTRNPHLLGIEGLDRSFIDALFALAGEHKRATASGVPRTPLAGRVVANLFFEDSTRTRTSFEIAAKTMGAEVLNWTVTGTSVSKGEGLIDTARNVDAIGPAAIVIRHGSSGAAQLISRYVRCSVINAGDGAHEHPSQALLDAFTLQERLGTLKGKHVLIAGDILHSRVARSNIYCLGLLGASVMVSGPPTLIPKDIEALGCKVATNFRQAVEMADAVMMLRVQAERQTDRAFPSAREYAAHWGLNGALALQMKDGAVVLHPGPVNWGVELSPEVAEGVRSTILEQVANGVAIRMAILETFAW